MIDQQQLNILAEAEADIRKVRILARRLALALAGEVAFHGDADSAEASLLVLADAREQLGLADEFEIIDSLKRKVPESRYVQLCGHPLSSIVSSDEGTHYCRECEDGRDG